MMDWLAIAGLLCSGLTVALGILGLVFKQADKSWYVIVAVGIFGLVMNTIGLLK